MASKATKIRLVRCPKCLKLLPELPNFPVYQCGGCGTTLQAKKIKQNQEIVSTAALDQNSAKKSEPENDSEDKESTSSSQMSIMSSTDVCEQEKSTSRRILNGITTSDELRCPEKEEPSYVSGETKKLDGDHGRASDKENTSPDRQGIISGGSNCSSVTEKPDVDTVPSKVNASSLSEELDVTEKIVRRYADLIGSRSPIRSSPKTAEATGDTDRTGSRSPLNTAEATNGADPTGSKGPLKTAEATADSFVSNVDMVGNKLRSSRRRGSEPAPAPAPAPAKRSRGPLIAAEATDDTECTESRGPLETAEATDDADLIESKAILKTEATDNIISKDEMVGNKPRGRRGVSKPAPAKSFHGYDASISSNDGWGDQVSDLHSHASKRSLSGSQRVAELISTNEGTISKDISVGFKPELNQARELSLMSLDEKHSPDRDELPKNTRYSIQAQEQVTSHGTNSLSPAQSWLGIERDESKYKRRLGQRDAKSGPSKYRHSELLRSSVYPPQNLASVERDQMEILRKVDELRDQLNQSYVHSRRANEWVLNNENQPTRQYPSSSYHNPNLDQDLRQRYDVNFPCPSPRRYGPSTSMPLPYGYSQMPLPGSFTTCKHHSNCPCSNAYKEDWQRLQSLPPPNYCYNEGLCNGCPCHVCYSLYSSIPSSPIPHPMRSSELRTLAYDQINSGHEAENPPRRERRQTIKRHCRPIAGGAPFIICYSCRKPLYLPADSFLSSKRCHRLQCGSCSKVLMFSLDRGTHIARYSQKVAVPPPGLQGDPVSFSEDYGLSICKSNSTDGEFGFFRSNAVDKKQEKLKNKMQASDSGSLSNGALKQKATGPSLHHLMGYSSVSRLLNAPHE